jgi:hypothetical protein
MSKGTRYLSALFIISLIVGANQPAKADAISRLDLTFQPNAANMNVMAANDFHLSTGANVLKKPASTGGFMNNWTVPTRKVEFTQGTVNKGAKLGVTITTKLPNPQACGVFTVDGNPVSNQICAEVLDVTNLAMTGTSSGTDVTFALTNNLGSPLTGSVFIYIHDDLVEDFNQESFDTLSDAQLVFSDSLLDLNIGESISPLFLTLNPDQYILIRGNIDIGNGQGSSSFAIGISAVPEPSSMWLLAGGLALLFGIHRSGSKGALREI